MCARRSSGGGGGVDEGLSRHGTRAQMGIELSLGVFPYGAQSV